MEISKATEEGTIYEGLRILARIIARAIVKESSTKQESANRRDTIVPNIESTGDIKGEQDKRLVMSVSEVIGNNVFQSEVAYARDAAGGGTSISPGEVEIGYQVQVSYFIAP